MQSLTEHADGRWRSVIRNQRIGQHHEKHLKSTNALLHLLRDGALNPVQSATSLSSTHRDPVSLRRAAAFRDVPITLRACFSTHERRELPYSWFSLGVGRRWETERTVWI